MLFEKSDHCYHSLKGIHASLRLDSPVLYALRGVGVKPPPGLIKHLEIIFTQRLCIPWAEGLQDDCDVHVDHQQDGQQDVGCEEADGNQWVDAVPGDRGSWVLHVGVAVWREVHEGTEQTGPSGWRSDHKHTDDAVPKRLKVKHVVDPFLLLHIGKVKHAEDGEGEHDDEEEEANVEEGRKWLQKGHKQRPGTPGTGNEMEDTSYTSHSEQRKQSGRDKELLQ